MTPFFLISALTFLPVTTQSKLKFPTLSRDKLTTNSVTLNYSPTALPQSLRISDSVKLRNHPEMPRRVIDPEQHYEFNCKAVLAPSSVALPNLPWKGIFPLELKCWQQWLQAIL